MMAASRQQPARYWSGSKDMGHVSNYETWDQSGHQPGQSAGHRRGRGGRGNWSQGQQSYQTSESHSGGWWPPPEGNGSSRTWNSGAIPPAGQVQVGHGGTEGVQWQSSTRGRMGPRIPGGYLEPPPSPPWDGGDMMSIRECKRKFVEFYASCDGAKECTEEAMAVLLGDCMEDETEGDLMLIELDQDRPAEELLPRGFHFEGPLDALPLSAGYLVVHIRETTRDAAAAAARLAKCWWALTQVSQKLITLVFAIAPERSLDLTEVITFREFHRQVAIRSPAPMVFVSSKPAGESGVPNRPIAAGAHRRAAHAAGADGAERAAGSVAMPKKTPQAQRPATARDEEDLVAEVAAFLQRGPKEVQELASAFAQRFNFAVRSRPDSPYTADGKNDGSFKRWLIAQGFVPSAMFENNKSIFKLPAGGVPSILNAKVSAGFSAQTKHQDEVPATPPQRPSAPEASSHSSFSPPHGVGSQEAKALEADVLSFLAEGGTCDVGALREHADFGTRFSSVFYHKPSIRDGSWKKWLSSLPGIVTEVDQNGRGDAETTRVRLQVASADPFQ